MIRLLLPLITAMTGALCLETGRALASPRFALVPQPHSLTVDGRNAPMTHPWAILSSQAKEDSVAIDLLGSEFKDAYGWHPLHSRHKGARVIEMVRIPSQAGTDSLFRQQGYYLTITPRRITVSASTAQGRYYGVQTLRQLVRTSAGTSLPCLRIRDTPSLAVRGVSEDISRGQLPTLTAMRATIRELGYYKLNTYHIYIEDVFALEALTKASTRRNRLTSGELALLASEAKLHHVVLVPVLQTLGHQERILSMPAFRHLAEVPPPAPTWFDRLISVLAKGDQSPQASAGGGAEGEEPPTVVPGSLCPVDPKARAFIREAVVEVCASASMPFLHCGGDEPTDLGKGRSMAAVKRMGLGAVYADYYADLNRTVRERCGRQMMLYSDMLLAHDDAMRHLPKDVVVIDWHYDPQSAFGSLDTLQRRGFRAIACAGLWNWRSFYPAYGRAFENIRGAVRGARRHGAWGAIVASWGDGGAECLNEANWAGYAYLAACTWREAESDEGEFLRAYALTAFGAGGESIRQIELALGWADLAARPWHGRVFAKPPTIHPRTDAWLAAMAATRTRMREALKLIAAAEGRISHNHYRLSVMRHAADRYLFLAEREMALDDIARSLQPQRIGARERGARTSAAARLKGCADRLSHLRGDYESLWQQSTQPDGLADIAARLLLQENAFRELERSARNGSLVAWHPRSARSR